MMSRRSSSVRMSSMSVIALAEANGILRPIGYRASEVAPTTTSELPLPRISASSPFRRNTSWPPTPLTRNGSRVLLTRSTTHSSASSVRRCVDSAERGSSPLSTWRLTFGVDMLELDHLDVLQHPRPILPGVFLDFLHRELDLPRLEVGDEDLAAPLELGELLGEHARAEVLRHDREALLAVAECALDDQVLEVRDLVDDRPELVVRRGVPGEHQAPPAAVELIADRGADVVVGQRRERPAATEVDRGPEVDRLVAQERPLRARDLGEVGPDRPVEDVVLQDLERRGNRVDRERLVAHLSHGVDHERDRGDVIEVRVGEEHMVDRRELREREVADAGPGVDQDVAIEQHRGGAQMPPADPAAAAQDPDSHRSPRADGPLGPRAASQSPQSAPHPFVSKGPAVPAGRRGMLTIAGQAPGI